MQTIDTGTVNMLLGALHDVSEKIIATPSTLTIKNQLQDIYLKLAVQFCPELLTIEEKKVLEKITFKA